MKQCLLLLLLLSCTAAYTQPEKPTGADPWAGTWKLDTTKSTLHAPAPKEETVTVDSANKNSVKYTIKGTDPEGKPYTVTYDGKVGTPAAELVDGKEAGKLTYEMPSSHEFKSESHSTDGSMGTATITLSRDGKTITVKEHRKDARGEFDQTAVYVRE